MDRPPKKVAVVKRWTLKKGLNKSQCMDCPPQKSGRCEAVTVAERSKQESMYGLFAQKKWPL